MRKVQPKSYHYIENLSAPEEQNKKDARENSKKLGLESISISKVEAQIIQFHLTEIIAKKVVEIGTLTGLSALYILESMEGDGYLWTLEKSAEHAQLASEVLSDYIRNKKCKVVLGDAKENLQILSAQGPFDAVFIDGNKSAYLDYFNWALENTRLGGLIIADNVFLAGAVWEDQENNAEPKSKQKSNPKRKQKFNEKQIRVVNKMNELAFSNKNLKSMIIPTEEGLLICKKLS